MSNIVIIGGGVSGLSAGIYAQLGGHHGIVCEGHFIAGGNLTGWDRGGYHIDNCIHWLTGTNPVTPTYKMWKELGALGDVEIMYPESLYTCELDGKTLSMYCDLDKIEKEMLEISPEDKRETRSFIKAVRTFQGALGIGGKCHNEKDNIFTTILGAPTIIKYYSLTTKELSQRFKHPLLKAFIVGFWGDNFGSLALIMVMAHFCANNGGIPRGSSRGMAERMTKKFTDLGGELLLKKEVVKINHQNGKAHSVTFADGSSIDADYVVITSDPAESFKRLMDIPMPKSLEKKYNNSRLYRFSGYHCAFACDLADLPFQGDLIFEIPEKYREILNTNHLIMREFSHEKDFAPEGKNILQTLTFCYEKDALEFIRLREEDKEAYKAKKEMISQILKELIEDKLPELQGKLEVIDFWTPATYRRFVRSEIGSFMSFALPSKSLPLRTSNKVDGFSNVFLATQWQQTPGGLPIAAEGGRLAIEAIKKAEAKK